MRVKFSSLGCIEAGKDGGYIKLRLYQNTRARALNALHVYVKYSLPLIKEICNKIAGLNIASRLDLMNSLNQLTGNLRARQAENRSQLQ
jgi:hypothetical protein